MRGMGSTKRCAILSRGNRWITDDLGHCVMGAIVLLVLVTGCRGEGETARRVRRYFDIPSSEQINAQTIRAAIVAHVPPGSAPSTVYGFLDQRGIGKDGRSSYDSLNADGEIVCRVEYGPGAFELVKKSFLILFIIGSDGMVKDVRIKAWVTGP